jgi:hypothetical protein
MIDPETKAAIREQIVKANLALHRGQIRELTGHLQLAVEISKTIQTDPTPDSIGEQLSLLECIQ